MSRLLVKICGLTTEATLAAALDAGADMIGLNFHPASPRYTDIASATRFSAMAKGRSLIVALLVDPDDQTIVTVRDAVKPAWLQLHGREDAARVTAVARLAGLPVLKAVGISGPGDLVALPALADAADLLLLDAKPPADAAYPGGHGEAFDWAVLAAFPSSTPFMLSGGLTPETVATAIAAVRAMGLTLAGVDVSSGVESGRGIKDVGKIAAFVAAVRAADVS